MMSFSQSIVTCFKKYFTISGRATRAEYWWFCLFIYLILGFIIFLGIMLKEDDLMGVAGLILIAVFCPRVCVLIRRLHDTGRSGACLLLNLIPYIGWFIIFIITLLDSDEDNEYGPNPFSGNNSSAVEEKANDDNVVEVSDVEL